MLLLKFVVQKFARLSFLFLTSCSLSECQSDKIDIEKAQVAVTEKISAQPKIKLKNIQRLSEKEIEDMPLENLRGMALRFGRDAYEYMVIVYSIKYPTKADSFDWENLGLQCDKKILSKKMFTQKKMKSQAKVLFRDADFAKALREPFNHCRDIFKENHVPADQIENFFEMTNRDGFTFFSHLKNEEVIKALRVKNPKSILLNYNYSLLSAQRSIKKVEGVRQGNNPNGKTGPKN